MLSYRSEGSGPAVVLLHGLLMDRSMWDEQVDALKDSYRVITPDAPGHGESAPAEVGYDFERYASDVWALLDSLGVASAVFGGQSMGGWTSLRCVAQRPDAVRGLMLIDTSVQPENPDAKPQYEAFLQVALAEGVSEDLANILLMILFSSGFAASPAAEPWRKKLVEGSPADYHAMARAVLDRPDCASLLTAVRCPAVVIHGEEDVAISMDRAEQIASALNAPLHRIPDAGHCSPAEQPAAVTPLLRSFLNSLPA